MRKECRANPNDNGQHHHLDAGRNDVAKDALCKKRGFAPQRERHQDKARQGGELELQNRDEELHRQNEEGEDDDKPGATKTRMVTRCVNTVVKPKSLPAC